MFDTIKMNFDKLYIKFLNWMNGEGFKMPDPIPKVYYMYNYYKSISNGENQTIINAYENEIKLLTDKCPNISREEVARSYVKAFEQAYGKEKF